MTRALLVPAHEACVCGHCRCQHVAGFGPCSRMKPHKRHPCGRYTWPGPGAKLPPTHTPGAVFGRRVLP